MVVLFRFVALAVSLIQKASLQGFNTQCGDTKARWGWCSPLVSASSCNAADSTSGAFGAIGLGIQSEDCCQLGAGYTNGFVSDTPQGAATDTNPMSGLAAKVFAWVLIREYAPPYPVGWSVVLKTTGDSTFGYDSPHWTSERTLNEWTRPQDPGNAKYSAYNELRFDAVRACVDSLHNCVEYEVGNIVDDAERLFNSGRNFPDSIDADLWFDNVPVSDPTPGMFHVDPPPRTCTAWRSGFDTVRAPQRTTPGSFSTPRL